MAARVTEVIFMGCFCSCDEFISNRFSDTSGSCAVCAGAIISAKWVVTSSWGEAIFFSRVVTCEMVSWSHRSSKCHLTLPWQGGDCAGISVWDWQKQGLHLVTHPSFSPSLLCCDRSTTLNCYCFKLTHSLDEKNTGCKTEEEESLCLSEINIG